ncbi:hypothetical protein PRZ48_013544 [Zasmidium cellare]|uniref:Uncharacterized protein n=1 Tax=Zasmidium cellare TaxID=395010 RepID=A0ABR0E1C6_ZASCE|nr:hypothetical protein PRZ48_013544 [Zasmidium cellare]
MLISYNDPGASPKYGPPVTPAIFRDKWSAKFQAFFDFKACEADESDPVWMSHLCETGYEVLINFRAQATELRLHHRDFANGAEQEGMPATRADAVKAIGQNNPFFTATSLLWLVDSSLSRLEGMKHGDPVPGTTWQQLPLKCRQRVNELLLKVAEAKTKGWWSVPGDVAQHLSGLVRQGTQSGTWRLPDNEQDQLRGLIREGVPEGMWRASK